MSLLLAQTLALREREQSLLPELFGSAGAQRRAIATLELAIATLPSDELIALSALLEDEASSEQLRNAKQTPGFTALLDVACVARRLFGSGRFAAARRPDGLTRLGARVQLLRALGGVFD